MKLLRYGPPGLERPGLLDGEGRVRDLSAHVHDISGSTLLPATLQRLAAINHGRLPLVEVGVRLGPCVARVGKLVCLEARGAQPDLHLQAPSAISGADDAVQMPPGALALDARVTLGVVIGQRALRVAPEQALFHVAGYCLLGAIRARGADAQLPAAGRHHDTFAPLGPWLVTPDELAGFDVAEVLADVSQRMSLQPGDIISVPSPGTGGPYPLGEAEARRFSITGLGEQRLRLGAMTAEPQTLE